MDSRGIAKPTIRALAICGLALGVATSAGAEQQPFAMSTGSPHLHQDSAGNYSTTDEAGNKIPCNAEDNSGFVICSTENPEKRGVREAVKGFWDGGKEQIDKAKEKLNEFKDALNLESLKEKFSEHEQPWCHEVRPGTNCIEYIPPAASTASTGSGTTINVHAPAAAEADPFDSVYDNYKSPTASRFGRVIGRAIKQKAERDRRKAEHKRLLSTLDRREGRTVEHKRQRAIAKSSAPPATRSRVTQPTGSTPRWRRPPVQVIQKPKSYAVKPTDYSRKRCGGYGYVHDGSMKMVCTKW